MMEFIRSIQSRDPARPTVAEVIFAYPGFHIMTIFHPVANFLWNKKLRALARFWSYTGRWITGIEIHPGAKIGKRLFIDHGTGVVIGETAIIGDDCTMYHNITLGGKGNNVAGTKRHPTLGNNVTIGAGAQILGAITLNDHSCIGANAVVTIDIPAGVTAVGNPARILGKASDQQAYGLPEGEVRDPVMETILRLEKELAALRESAKNRQ